MLGFDYCLFIWILEPQPDDCMLQWIIQSGQHRNDHPTGTLEFILTAVSVYSYEFKKNASLHFFPHSYYWYCLGRATNENLHEVKE